MAISSVQLSRSATSLSSPSHTAARPPVSAPRSANFGRRGSAEHCSHLFGGVFVKPTARALVRERGGSTEDGPLAGDSTETSDHKQVANKPPKSQERDFSGTAYVPVYVMLPLGVINMDCELVDPDNLHNQLKTLKSVNVDGVMVDCWWGIVERHVPQQYNWNGYKNLFQLVLDLKLKLQLIRSGEIDEAFDKLQSWYPQIIQDDTSPICFLLHCQRFIELIRAGKVEEALAYGRVEFEKFNQLTELDDLVKDCATLLAYEQPQKSSVGYLLEESQREIVADAVNATILSATANPNLKDSRVYLYSKLEKLLRQLTACYMERRSLNGDQGEAFHLRRVLNSDYKNY